MIIALLFSTAVVTGLLGLYVWHSSSSQNLLIFGLFIFTVALWSFCVGFETLAQNLEGKLFFSKLQYLGVAPLPVLWVVFTLSYTGRRRWTRLRNILPLLFIPALTLIIALTNSRHGLLYQDAYLETTAFRPDLVVKHGAWFWGGHMAYSYTLLAVGVGVLLYSYEASHKLYRKQYRSLLIASSFPIVANLLFLSGANPLGGVDPTPLSFALSCMIIAPALLRYRLFDLMPVARRTVIETLPVGIFVIDLHDRIIDVNPEGQRLLSLGVDALIGTQVSKLIPAWSVISDLYGTSSEPEELSLSLGGHTLELDVTVVDLKNAQQATVGYTVMARDISVQKAYETMALKDPLTNLPNRRFLELEAHKALRVAQRAGWQVAILYLDLDKFKPVNDRFGHDVGDHLLKKVAQRIQASARASDIIARFGGDEFVILAQGVDVSEATEIANRILATISQPFQVEGHTLTIGGSIGVALFPNDAQSLEHLIQNADTAMYAAKIAGIGVRFYEAHEAL